MRFSQYESFICGLQLLTNYIQYKILEMPFCVNKVTIEGVSLMCMNSFLSNKKDNYRLAVNYFVDNEKKSVCISLRELNDFELEFKENRSFQF